MNNGIGAIVSLLGALGSIFGMGTSTMSQVAMMRQQMHPPAIAQTCPPNTDPQYVTGPDGRQQLVCYARQPQN